MTVKRARTIRHNIDVPEKTNPFGEEGSIVLKNKRVEFLKGVEVVRLYHSYILMNISLEEYH